MDGEDSLNVTQPLERKLRLKALLDEAQRLDHNITKCDTATALQTIHSIMKESNKILKEGGVKDRAEHTTEVVLDAHVLKINHELVSKVFAENLEFNEKLYSNAIKSVVNKSVGPNWENFAELVCPTARTVNLRSSMLGAVEVELKVDAPKQRQRRKNLTSQEKRPETVSKLKRQDKGAEKVNMVHRQLASIFKQNHCQTMPFYKLIVDPRNFMNSVENAFQLAFLARDGVIGVDIGEDGHPCVRLASSFENKTQLDTTQWICSLDMAKCKEMARFYKIKEPLLKVQLEDFPDDDEDGEEYIKTDHYL